VLLTVVESANEPRGPAAKRMMKHKNAKAPAEIEKSVRAAGSELSDDEVARRVKAAFGDLQKQGSLIEQWSLADLEADLAWCGRNGSPTKVHRIQSVVLAAKESRVVEPTDDGLSQMIGDLIEDKIIA
jgi:electron transfer flavoprotein beta subunit